MSSRKLSGPAKLIKYHYSREEQVMEIISQYGKDKTYHINCLTHTLSPDSGLLLPTLIKYENDSLTKLSSKEIPSGYLAELL